jgi:hypothetical protein
VLIRVHTVNLGPRTTSVAREKGLLPFIKTQVVSEDILKEIRIYLIEIIKA